ncbi:phage adaptor protein [Rhodanobacter lindaniclasticus]
MNTGALLAACREMLNDLAQPYGWDDAQLVRYLNNAVGEACLRARLLKDDASTLPELCVYPVEAGESLIRLRPEVIVVRSGRLAGQPHKLWALTSKSMDRLHGNWEDESRPPDTPQHLVMDVARKTVRLWPTPAANGELHLRVWRMPLARERLCVDQPKGEPVVDVPNIEDLKHWVGHEAYLTKDGERNDPAASALHLTLFENRFGERPTLHEMARWADSPPRVRYAQMY